MLKQKDKDLDDKEAEGRKWDPLLLLFVLFFFKPAVRIRGAEMHRNELVHLLIHAQELNSKLIQFHKHFVLKIYKLTPTFHLPHLIGNNGLRRRKMKT